MSDESKSYIRSEPEQFNRSKELYIKYRDRIRMVRERHRLEELTDRDSGSPPHTMSSTGQSTSEEPE